MRLFYICAPFSAEDCIGKNENIIRAAGLGAQIRKAGGAVIVPHLTSMFSEDSLSEEQWISQDIELLARCDFLVVAEGKITNGMSVEINFAVKYGIRIISIDQAIREARKTCQFQ